jgi:hypothetical protein
VTGFVELRLLGHHHFPVEQTPFIDHELRCTDVPFDDRLPFEDDFLCCDNRAPYFSAYRDVLRRYIPINLASYAYRETFTCCNLAGDLAIDADISLTSDLSFNDGTWTDEVEFFDRISFQCLSSFRS